MLRNFRTAIKSNRTPVATIMIVLTIGLLAYLVPSGNAVVTPETVLGRVYGREIKQRDIDQALMDLMQRFGGGQAQQEQLLPLLKPQAVQTAIQDKIVEELCEREGIVVSDAEIKTTLELILKSQAKQQPELIGLFDSSGRLRSMDELVKIYQEPVRAFINTVERVARKEAVRQKLFQIYAHKVPVSSERLDLEHRLKEEKMTFKSVIVTPSMQDIGDPGDGPLEVFLKAEGSLFKQGLRRKIQVVAVSRDMVGDLNMDEAAVRKAYENQKASLTKAPEVKGRHILFDATTPQQLVEAKKVALEVREQLIKGEKFETLATKYNSPQAAGPGGDLGWFDRSRMVKEFGDVAFSLKVGEISQPVQTQYGIHLIRIEDRRAERVTPFDEVKAKLQLDLTEERYAQKAKEKLELLRKKAGQGDLASAAQSLGLKAINSSPFEATDTPSIEGLFNVGDLATRAFSKKMGEVSTPELIGSSYMVYRVEKELKSSVPPLNEIRPKVLLAWRQEQAAKATRVQMQALRQAGTINAFKDLGSITETKSVAIVTKQELVTQPQIRQALLQTPVNELTPIILQEDGSFWCAQVSQRETPKPLTVDSRLDLVNEIQNREAGQMLQYEVQRLLEVGKSRSGLRSLWGLWDGIWIDEKALGLTK